jgi:hypothetical protein
MYAVSLSVATEPAAIGYSASSMASMRRARGNKNKTTRNTRVSMTLEIECAEVGGADVWRYRVWATHAEARVWRNQVRFEPRPKPFNLLSSYPSIAHDIAQKYPQFNEETNNKNKESQCRP